MRLDEAALYFGCSSRSMILCTEGVFCISIYCYDAAWTRHLKFCAGVEWDRIKTSRNGTPQKCMVATAERDNIKGQAFASEVVRRTENDFQCDGSRAVSFYAWYYSLVGSCGGLDS